MSDKWAMLCRLKVEAFDDPRWRWERKLDGDRIRMDIDGGGKVRLTARSGADKTRQFPELQLVAVGGGLPLTLDGEVVSAQGLSFSEFNQRRMNRQKDIDSFARELPALFVPFDVLELGGADARWMQFSERRKRLVDVVRPNRFMDTAAQFDDGKWLFGMAKDNGWEGVVGKDITQPYLPGRRAWVKVKVWLPPSVYYVLGFTKGTGKRASRFGALMIGRGLACYEGVSHFEYVCDVGTGIDDAELERLDELRQTMPAYKGLDLGQYILEEYKTGPLLKVSVKAVEETNAGSLRFPVYLGQVK